LVQSFPEVLIRPQKMFWKKDQIGIKNAKFNADFRSANKITKKPAKYVMSQKVAKSALLAFTHTFYLFFVCNFFLLEFFAVS